MKKTKIPAKLRQQVWIATFGEVFKAKCSTSWCTEIITVHNYHCGHKFAEKKGGPTEIKNLIPLCSICNLSMSNKSFEEWDKLVKPTPPTVLCTCCALQ